MSGISLYRSPYTDSLSNPDTSMSDDMSIPQMIDSQCESPVQKLKNNALPELSLEKIKMNFKQFSNLTEALKENTSLKSLNLSGCGINDNKLQLLCEALKVNKALTSLDLSKNEITHQGARYLATALRANTVLTHLNLWGNKIGHVRDPEELGYDSYECMTNMAFFPSYLEDYNEDENKVIKSIRELGLAISTSTTLKELELGNNELSDIIEELFRVITDNQSITYLGLSKNSIPQAVCGSIR